MSCKPRQIIGNIFNLARDYNRYCGRVIGNLGANIPVIAWILDLVKQDSTFTCAATNRTCQGFVGDTAQLITNIPTDVQAIVGGRWDGTKFLTTDTSGNTLAPYTLKSTPSGTVRVFSSGLATQLEAASENIVTCRKHSPTDLTNVTKAGNAAAVLSLVTDTTELVAAGIDVGNHDVYKLDNNQGGAGAAFATLSGATANTNKHSGMIWMRTNGVSCNLSWNTTALGEFGTTTSLTYVELCGENVTPTAAGNRLLIAANIGAIAYFILPQLEESTFLSSLIITPADPLTSLARAATRLLDTTAGRMSAASWGLKWRGTPIGTGQSSTLFSTYVDANNYTAIITTATQVILREMVGGVPTDTTETYTHLADVPMEVHAKHDGVKSYVRAFSVGDAVPAYAETAYTTDSQIGTNFEDCSLNDTDHFSANNISAELDTNPANLGI